MTTALTIGEGFLAFWTGFLAGALWLHIKSHDK